MLKLQPKQWVLLFLAIMGWAIVYILQEFDYTRLSFQPGQYHQGFIPEGEDWRFVINKGIRFLLNDLISLLFIYAFFNNRKYTSFAIVVMAFGVLILLPVYLCLALSLKEDGANLLVFLHRITMNPWLMLLLVPAFLYQSRK